MDHVAVLHVDDEPEFASMTAEFLERIDERFEVTTATGAAEALETLDGGAFDCVVSDYDMPGRNGIEFLRTVREEFPDLPFILFTGKGSEEVASEAISAGVTDYLEKRPGTGQYELLANRIANVVDRHRSQRVLTERKRRLETLISNLPGMVYRCRNERGWPMEFVGGECEEVTGYDASALETGAVSYGQEVVHPEHRDSVWETVQSAVADDEPFELTYRIVTADGETRWVWERGRGVRGSGGDATAIEGFISDITARKKRESQLASQSRALRRLLDAANRLYAAKSEADCYDVAIDAAVDILGFDWCTVAVPDETGQVFEIEAVSEDAPVEVGSRPFGTDEGIAGEVFRTGEVRVDENVHDADESKPTDDAIRAALTIPVGDWGVFQAVATRVGAFDEADRRHAELLVTAMATAVERIEREAELRDQTAALERQNERLDEFASVVSHDLRNPLNVAQGNLELLEDGYDQGAVQEAQAAIDRAQNLIADLLKVTRNGDRVGDLEAVSLTTVCRQCWNQVATARASLETEADRTILADRSQLRQLLENLLRNAVDHGGEAVAVRVGTTEDGFYVADDGQGIPEAERDLIFESGYSTDEDGTGYGLNIVDEVADAHGWSIRVTEAEGGGARFEVTDVEVVDG